MARANKVIASITYYVPCSDKDSFSYGYQGQYITETGIVWRIGMRDISLGDKRIPLEDIVSIESDGLWEDYAK
jgi:hypothetical protein